MFMPERDTMHLRNNRAVAAISFFLLFIASVMGAQAKPGQNPPAQGNQQIQATPLPSGVDPNDPALPVWARPATSPPAAAPSPARPAAGPNVPGNRPANSAEPPISEGSVGEVTRDASGGFKYVSRVNEVTLSATVLDSKRHLVTNLQPTNFVVYEDGQP